MLRGTPSFLSKKAKNVHAWTVRNREDFTRAGTNGLKWKKICLSILNRLFCNLRAKIVQITRKLQDYNTWTVEGCLFDFSSSNVFICILKYQLFEKIHFLEIQLNFQFSKFATSRSKAQSLIYDSITLNFKEYLTIMSLIDDCVFDLRAENFEVSNPGLIFSSFFRMRYIKI